MDEVNRQVIEEFRANDGLVDDAVGGDFKGKPMLLLQTQNPGWLYNLKANPDVSVDVGTESHPGRASLVTGPERDGLYAAQVRQLPQFAEYEEKTTRTIPAVALERTG